MRIGLITRLFGRPDSGTPAPTWKSISETATAAEEVIPASEKPEASTILEEVASATAVVAEGKTVGAQSNESENTSSEVVEKIALDEQADDKSTSENSSDSSDDSQEESSPVVQESDKVVESASPKTGGVETKTDIAEPAKNSETIGEKAPILDGSENKVGAASQKMAEAVKTPVAENSNVKVEASLQGEAKAEQLEQKQAPKSTVKMANQAAMINRIASNVRLMVGRKQSSIRMDLDPPELGKMQVRLTVKGTGLTGYLRVESVEARDAITQNLDTLKNALEKEGIAISEFTVDVDTRQGGKGFEGQYRNNQNMADNTPGSLDIPELSDALSGNIMTQDRLNLIA